MSSAQYTLHWDDREVSRSYFAALHDDLSGQEIRSIAIDGTVPGDVMWAAGAPAIAIATFCGNSRPITFVEASTDGLSMVDQQGPCGPSASTDPIA